MANNITGSGLDGFSDKLVGNQFTDGTSQFTLGNFGISKSITDKEDQDFSLGNFSAPITLDTLSSGKDEADNRDAVAIIKRNSSNKAVINFDVSDVTTFTQYGSLNERFKVAVKNILKTFPAAITVNKLASDYSTSSTAVNILFDPFENETNFDIDITRMSNPFAIEFTTTGMLFFSGATQGVDEIRNMTKEFGEYSVFIDGNEFKVIDLTPSTTNLTGLLNVTARGDVFSGLTNTINEFQLRPNTYKTEEIFDKMEDVEKFILNRKSTPKYTAEFKTLRESNKGKLTQTISTLTWPTVDSWNIVSVDDVFVRYLTKLYDIADTYDTHKTNLISRFLTTGALKEFDTEEQMFEKVIQLYGRSFDEIKKYIDGIAYMTNVTYDSVSNIPDILLKNLAQLLGWGTPNSINEVDIVQALFNRGGNKEFSGVSDNSTPVELDIELYRKILMNTAYLFKSKGTRKSIEFLLRLIGAPEGLIEFNEHVYIAGKKINMDKFNMKLNSFSGGTYTEEVPVITDTFIVQPQIQNFPPVFTTAYTYSTEIITRHVSARRGDYPVDDFGYPKLPKFSKDGYFQTGAGWFERTPEHRSLRILDEANSTFTGDNPTLKSKFVPFTYGETYLDYMRGFPHMRDGFDLKRTVDNKKSWVESDGRNYDESFRKLQNRVSTLRNRGSKYHSEDERLVLNVKNVDLFLNVGQALVWDVWNNSNKFGCLYGLKTLNSLNPLYPTVGGPDWTEIQIDASKLSFFEFADGFWKMHINVKNRQTIDDGHGGGYPTLMMVYLDYLDSQNVCNVPDGQYTYEGMLDFVDEIGDYWIRLVEQMIPATTIWQGGIKIENSIFHRYKYSYKHEPICDDLECLGSWVECVGPNFNEVIVNGFLASQAATFSGATWYNKITLNGTTYTGPEYYNSTTLLDIPTTEMWLDNMVTILSGITGECFTYMIFDDTTTGNPAINNPKSIVVQGCCEAGKDVWSAYGDSPALFLGETCLNMDIGRANLTSKKTNIYAFYDTTSTTVEACISARNNLDTFSDNLRLTGWSGKTYHIPSDGGGFSNADERWLSWASYPWTGNAIHLTLSAGPWANQCNSTNFSGVRHFCEPDTGEFAVIPDGASVTNASFVGGDDDVLMIAIVDESNTAYHASTKPTGSNTDWGTQPFNAYQTDFNSFMSIFNNYDVFNGFIYPIASFGAATKEAFLLHLYGALETGWCTECVVTNWSGDTCVGNPSVTGQTTITEWSVQDSYTGTSYCYYTGDSGHTCNGLVGFSARTKVMECVSQFINNPTVVSDGNTLSQIRDTNPYTGLTGTNNKTGYSGPGLKNFGFGAKYDLGVPWSCTATTACSDPNCYTLCSPGTPNFGACGAGQNWSIDPSNFFSGGRFSSDLLEFLSAEASVLPDTFSYCEPVCSEPCEPGNYNDWQGTIVYDLDDVVRYDGDCYRSLISGNTVTPTIGVIASYTGNSVCGVYTGTGFTQTWQTLSTSPMNFYGGNDFIPQGDCESIKVIPEPPVITGTTTVNNPIIFKEAIYSIGGLDCFDSSYLVGEGMADICDCDVTYSPGHSSTYSIGDKICCPDYSLHSGTTYVLMPSYSSGGCESVICDPQVFDVTLCDIGTVPGDNECWSVCSPAVLGVTGRIATPTMIANTTYPWISMSNLPAGSSAIGNSVLMNRGSYDPTSTNRLGTTGNITKCTCDNRLTKSITYDSMNGLSNLFPDTVKNFKVKGTQYVKNGMKWATSSLNENGKVKVTFDTIGELSPCCLGDTFEVINHVYKGNVYLGVRKWIVDIDNMTYIYAYRMTKGNSDRAFITIPKEFITFKDSTMDNPYVDMVFGKDGMDTGLVVELGESTSKDFFGLFRIDGITGPTFLSNLTYWGNVNDNSLMTFSDMENILTDTTFNGDVSYGYQLEFNLLCNGSPATSFEINDTIVSYGGKSTTLYDVPESKPCPTDLGAKIPRLDPTDSDIIEKDSLISNVKSSSLTQTYGEGGLVTWDYNLFWKRYYPDLDSNNYEITSGKIYAVMNNPTYKTDMQIPYNTSATNVMLDPDTNMVNRSYLTYNDDTYYPKAKLSWLNTIISRWPGNTIQLFFRNNDVMDGFSYSLRGKHIGNVETLSLYNPNLTQSIDPSTELSKIPLSGDELSFSLTGATIGTLEPNNSFTKVPVFYKDLQDWIDRTLGSNPFTNTYVNYNKDGKFHYFEIRSEDSKPIDTVDGLMRSTPLKNLDTEFLATTYGDWEVYKNTHPSTSALTAIYNSYTDYSNYEDLTTDVVFDLSYVYSAYTGTTVIPMSGKDISGTMLQGTTNNTIGPAVKPEILSTNGGPLVVTSASTDYMYYKVKKSGSYRFQYKGILTFDYYDTGWCEYLKTNYKDNTVNTYPYNDFDYKNLVNNSILYVGGGSNIISTEGYDANKKTNVSPYFIVTPTYGYSRYNGLKDFKCEVFIERTSTVGTATTTSTLVNYVVGNNEEKYPTADDVLIMSVTPADKLSDRNLISDNQCGDGSGFVFNKVSNIVLDTKCVQLNVGDEIRVKNIIVIDSTSKSNGTTWVNTNLGSGVENGTIKKPWFRGTNEACGKPKKMYDLIWDVDQTSRENTWWNDGDQYKGKEKGTLYVTTSYTGKKLIIPPTINNVEDLSKLTYLDVTKKYKGPFDLRIAKGKTSNWNEKLFNGDFTDVKQPLKKTPFTWDGLMTTWVMPRMMITEGQTPSFPNYAHTYLVETLFRVKGTNRTFTHTVYYDDDVNTTMNQFNRTVTFSNSSAPLLSRETVSENTDQTSRKMYFEGTTLIIDGVGASILPNEYSIQQTVKEVVENTFFCECRTSKYAKVIANTNLDCVSGDCGRKCQQFCDSVRPNEKLIGKLSKNDINKKTSRGSNGKFRY